MAKQQTLTIVVSDDMSDPAYLVEDALERYLSAGPIRPEFGADPHAEFAKRGYYHYMIIEED